MAIWKILIELLNLISFANKLKAKYIHIIDHQTIVPACRVKVHRSLPVYSLLYLHCKRRQEYQVDKCLCASVLLDFFNTHFVLTPTIFCKSLENWTFLGFNHLQPHYATLSGSVWGVFHYCLNIQFAVGSLLPRAASNQKRKIINDSKTQTWVKRTVESTTGLSAVKSFYFCKHFVLYKSLKGSKLD